MNKQCFRILATHSMQLGMVRWNPALTDIVVQDGSSTTRAKEEIHPVLPCLIGIDASFPTQIHSTSTNEVSAIQALKVKRQRTPPSSSHGFWGQPRHKLKESEQKFGD